MWEFFGIFVSTAAGGAVAGACIYILGGLGVDRVIKRRLDEHDAELDHISARLTQETKRRASQLGNEERAARKSLKEEAYAKIAAGGTSGRPEYDIDPIFDA